MTARAAGAAATYTDAQVLFALEMVECGESVAKIARQMGVSRNAIIGLLFRVRRETDLVPDTATRPANRDGGMPRHWWKRGLAKRGAGE